MSVFDISQLESRAGIQIPLADNVKVTLDDLELDSVQGFSDISQVILVAKVSSFRGFDTPSVTVTVEHSSDDSSWSTLHEFEFTANGETIAVESAPDDYVRVTCARGGELRKAVVWVTAVPRQVDFD